MVNGKHITKLAAVLMAAAVFICLGAMMFSGQLTEAMGGAGVAMQYESELFDTDESIRVEIEMEPSEWEEMLAQALQEQYYSCDVTINGQKTENVGIRPKGNTSLSAIAMDSMTNRYSFKLEFDHYVEGQTCLGLDKLILNNNYADATNMKEAIVYDMYRYLGADASLYNYAEIWVNGKYWGVYLALEAVEDSFMLRNYGTKAGALYKPESTEPGGGRGMGGPEAEGSKGADLRYTDDEPDSYSSIWEGEVTDTGKEDHRRVIAALRQISEGTEPESCLDVDNVLKYMAVHVFSVNMDSLSGNMAHNYYLYEADGRLNILPWDYNLAFGGMGAMGPGMGGSGGASEMVNDAIDTPFAGTDFFDALLETEEYRAKYHEYLRQLTEEYVAGGRFEETYRRIRSQIDGLVDTDPTAFYSGEEYRAGAEMLYQTVLLRAESIRGQLEGTIPSTDEGQRADSSGLVNASAIDVAVMGEFNMGGGNAGNGGRGESPAERDGRPEEGPGRMEDMPEGMPDRTGDVPNMSGWSEDMPDKPEGIPDMPGGPEGVPDEAENTPGGPGGMPGGPWNLSSRQQEQPFDKNTPEAARSSNSLRAAGTCAVCLAVLVLALMIVKKYQRKPVSGKNA